MDFEDSDALSSLFGGDDGTGSVVSIHGSPYLLDGTALAEFFSTRPSIDTLRQLNIIRDPIEVETRRLQMITELNRRLQHRPTPNELLEKHVLKTNIISSSTGQLPIDPSIIAIQDTVRRLQHKDHLARFLRNRLSLNDLIQRNIVPRNILGYDGKINYTNNHNHQLSSSTTTDSFVSASSSSPSIDPSALATTSSSSSSSSTTSSSSSISSNASPAYGAKTPIEILSEFLGKRPTVHELLKAEVIKAVMMWTSMEIPSPVLPVPRHCHSMNLVNRSLYVLGGYGTNEASCTVHVLDIDNSSWERPLARSAAGFLPVSRYAHGTVCRGSFIIMFGGYGSGTWLNDIWILDVRTVAERNNNSTDKTNTSLNGLHTFLGPTVNGGGPITSLPPGFTEYTNTNIVPTLNNSISTNSTGGSSNGILPSSTSSSKTTDEEIMWYLPPIHSAPPNPRAAHSAVLLGNHMTIFGGNDGNCLYNDTWVLDLSANPLRWKLLETIGSTPSPRSGHTAVTDGTGRMYVFGGGEGWGADSFNDLFILDAHNALRQPSSISPTLPTSVTPSSPSLVTPSSPTTSSSSVTTPPAVWLRPSFTGTPPSPRTGHSACMINRTKMFVFGGGDARRSLNDLHILDTLTMTWSRPADSGALPLPRTGHSVCNINNYVVVFGGQKSDGSCYNDLCILDTDFSVYPTITDKEVVVATTNNKHSNNKTSTSNGNSNTAMEMNAVTPSPVNTKPSAPPTIPEVPQETDDDDEGPSEAIDTMKISTVPLPSKNPTSSNTSSTLSTPTTNPSLSMTSSSLIPPSYSTAGRRRFSWSAKVTGTSMLVAALDALHRTHVTRKLDTKGLRASILSNNNNTLSLINSIKEKQQAMLTTVKASSVVSSSANDNSTTTKKSKGNENSSSSTIDSNNVPTVTSLESSSISSPIDSSKVSVVKPLDILVKEIYSNSSLYGGTIPNDITQDIFPIVTTINHNHHHSNTASSASSSITTNEPLGTGKSSISTQTNNGSSSNNGSTTLSNNSIQKLKFEIERQRKEDDDKYDAIMKELQNWRTNRRFQQEQWLSELISYEPVKGNDLK